MQAEILFVPSTSAPAPAPLRADLNVAVVPAADSAGFFVALHWGLFAARGLHVKFMPAISSETVINAQAPGEAMEALPAPLGLTRCRPRSWRWTPTRSAPWTRCACSAWPAHEAVPGLLAVQYSSDADEWLVLAAAGVPPCPSRSGLAIGAG